MSYAVSITQDGTRLQTAGKYVDDDIVVGISDSIKKTAATYTPTTADQTIAAGQYLSGAQTVKGDANLIAANIRSGKSIFGVAGSLTPGITPSGTKQITSNGTYDVTEFASAAVNVPTGKIYKVASGTFTVTDKWSVTINHGLGTQNIIVIIQAVTTDGSPIVVNGRYLSRAVFAISPNLWFNINQEYKLSSDGVSQLLIQNLVQMNMNAEGNTALKGAYVVPDTLDIVNSKGLYNITDNSVDIGVNDRFSIMTYAWRIIGLMDGV